jgi:diguanylate cyclase (GGDEF)-like protein
MEQAEALSQAVMDVLKEFSRKKMPLNCAALKEIFATSEEILSLLAPDVQANTKERQDSGDYGEPGAPLLRASVAPEQLDLEQLPPLREVFLEILDGLAPAIKGNDESRFSLLLEGVYECQSLQVLSSLGKQVGAMVGQLINQAVENTDYSNDFLFELSKDLYQIGEQLSTYQEFNKESTNINNNFYTDILSHTTDIHNTIGMTKIKSDIHGMIIAKLIVISKAIDEKRKSDELRAVETEAKISELQNNIKLYEKELLQVRKRSESLEKEVLLDELTKISNRRSYDLHIKECLREYKRTTKGISLILIDIDHFKKINDTYGHKAGDKCLKEIAQRIKSSLRDSDFLARYGGEELIAILHGCDCESAENVADKIRHRIEKTRFYFHNEIIPVTVSLGVTQIMPSDTEPETPFIRVDEAMYRAKRGGRNKVCSSIDPLEVSLYDGGPRSADEEPVLSVQPLRA